MTTRPSRTPGRHKQPRIDRRAAPDNAGSLQRLRGLLVRPLRLEQRGGRWRLVLVERRSAPRGDGAPSLSQLRAELRARLVAYRIDHSGRVMRHVAFVRDELGRRGWAGAEALPAAVLARALVQAEMLASSDPSPAMALLTDRLRWMATAAQLREERIARQRAGGQRASIEVSETTHEEFSEVERSWVGDAPPPDRAGPGG